MWWSEVPWLTVGLVVGPQSMRTRVLVISRLVLLTPGLLVPELQKHGFGFFFKTTTHTYSSSILWDAACKNASTRHKQKSSQAV